jgi:hypothetical protein
MTRAARGEEAGSGLGHAKIEKGEGKEEASWAGLRFQLGFSLLPNRNSENPFLFQIFFIICKLIWILTTSTHVIKYKNTSQYKGKYASAWNATNKYLFKYINL